LKRTQVIDPKSF